MIFQYACAIIINSENKLLLLKRSEKEDSEQNKWCPVNETIEYSEAPEDAVIRGVMEEVGMQFKIENVLEGDKTAVFKGNADGEIKLNKDESLDYGWFSYEEVKSLDLAFDYATIIKQVFNLGWIK